MCVCVCVCEALCAYVLMRVVCLRAYMRGWVLCCQVARFEIKPFAALFSHFREVLLLDSDNIPVRDPVRSEHVRWF